MAQETRMPLSEPEERELLHSRDIVLRGYRRADGLFDIEAQLTDTKSYGFRIEGRGWIEPGDPLHQMWMRLTVDEDLLIVACEAASDHTPYSICPGAAPNMARLAGLRIKPGFLKEAALRVGGTQGCTHLRELLQQLATVAYQTLYPVRARKTREEANSGKTPALLNSCYAYSSDRVVVKRRWPHLYTGSDAPETGIAATLASSTEDGGR
jgi:Protein of unknown function (DUF2889)